jgi:hypothetical protein
MSTSYTWGVDIHAGGKMGAKVKLVKKISDIPRIEPPIETDPAKEVENLRLVEHMLRKGIRNMAPRADRGPLHQSRIQIIDRHTGKRGISRAVSMVHHLIHMASEANITPEELVRSIIADSPEFRLEMAAFWSREGAGWSREGAGWKTPERGSK